MKPLPNLPETGDACPVRCDFGDLAFPQSEELIPHADILRRILLASPGGNRTSSIPVLPICLFVPTDYFHPTQCISILQRNICTSLSFKSFTNPFYISPLTFCRINRVLINRCSAFLIYIKLNKGT